MSDRAASLTRSTGALVAVVVLGYLAYALARDLPGTRAALQRFDRWLIAPLLATTLVNYGLRLVKWRWLLGRVGVELPWRAHTLTFLAGLGLVVSPAKAGELIKPWLVREMTTTPLARTLPVLFSERLTDAMAVVLLAAAGVSTFAPGSGRLVAATTGLLTLGALALGSPRATGPVVAILRRLPGGARVAGPAHDALSSLHACLSPGGLAAMLALSLAAWWAECVGYWLVFRGLGVPVGLDEATFLYAFATVFGAPSPGGVGLTDAALVEGALALVPHLTEGDAMGAALIVRAATLWFGVLMGAVVLTRLDAVVRAGRPP